MGKTTEPSVTKVGHAFWERGSWYHRTRALQDDGTIKHGKKGGFSTPEEAEESYIKYEEEITEQLRIRQANNNKQDMMFKDFLIYWFDNIYCTRTETTTQAVGAYILYDLIIPNIEIDVKLKQVTTIYLDEIIKRAFKTTPSGGYSSRLLIYMAFKDGVVNGYIKNNSALDTKTYKRPKPKILVLNKEQLRKLLKEARFTSWYLEILLALFCGLRKGEILALKHEDFNLEEQTLSISRQLVNDYIIVNGTKKIDSTKRVERDPKTENSFRTFKVPKVIMSELEKREQLIKNQKEKNSDRYNDNHYISCNEFGDNHALSSINGCLNKLCQKCSLPHITVHGLRHMFATILIEQGKTLGMDVKTILTKVSALLGHSSIHTTFEYYCEIMDERENILSYLNDIFSADEEMSK